MSSHDYLLRNLESTKMITLTVEGKDSIQYRNWNWFHQEGQFHLLRDDFSIGHIIHGGSVVANDDGSVTHTSRYFPKHIVMNFHKEDV